jgi:adenine-specific DNA-methyltransferase
MPTLDWVGKDKVVNHHHDVPFRLLDKQYSFTADENAPPIPPTTVSFTATT